MMLGHIMTLQTAYFLLGEERLKQTKLRKGRHRIASIRQRCKKVDIIALSDGCRPFYHQAVDNYANSQLSARSKDLMQA